MKGYTESEKLKHWWPTMLVVHACAHSNTMHKWGLTGPLHISSKLLRPRICAAHSEYMTSANAAPQRSLPDATQIYFFSKWRMTRFSEYAVIIQYVVVKRNKNLRSAPRSHPPPHLQLRVGDLI